MPTRTYRYNSHGTDRYKVISDNQILSGNFNAGMVEDPNYEAPEAPINLVGKNKVNYSEAVNNNFLWLTENHAMSPTIEEDGTVIIRTDGEKNPGPAKAILGQKWYNLDTMQYNVCLQESQPGSTPTIWGKIPTIFITEDDPSNPNFNPQSIGGDVYSPVQSGCIWIDKSSGSPTLKMHDSRGYRTLITFDDNIIRRGYVADISKYAPMPTYPNAIRYVDDTPVVISDVLQIPNNSVFNIKVSFNGIADPSLGEITQYTGGISGTIEFQIGRFQGLGTRFITGRNESSTTLPQEFYTVVSYTGSNDGSGIPPFPQIGNMGIRIYIDGDMLRFETTADTDVKEIPTNDPLWMRWTIIVDSERVGL